ncbi:MAG: DNA repair protein RecN, partial [Bacteroidales bacterium]|nr:DNA repair protein RecN [Bacteroidales bacterium]
LILDEIDTGVSGKIAAKVARMMKNLSRYMQVVAITHLPQIAAAADVHYRVYKTLEDGAAVSNMSRLSAQEHIESVASMLSNGPVTPVALQAARELVEG